MAMMAAFSNFMAQNGSEIWSSLIQQIYLVMIPMLATVVLVIPLTIVTTRVKALYPWLLNFSNAMYTVPSLALLSVLVLIGLGIGLLPSVVALFLYALMPVVRNTYVGIENVPAPVKDAAIGMGVTDSQLLLRVELPLALPVIIAGVRSALVTTIGYATLAAFIGGGGLGSLILMGLSQDNNALIAAGTIPAMLMAFLAEFGMALLERALTPRGVRAPARGRRAKVRNEVVVMDPG
jgi:osmoprotectant transport system permease protein